MDVKLIEKCEKGMKHACIDKNYKKFNTELAVLISYVKSAVYLTKDMERRINFIVDSIYDNTSDIDICLVSKLAGYIEGILEGLL